MKLMTDMCGCSNMETFDDKSEGKTSTHRPKIMFTKYVILAIIILFGEKNRNFYIIVILPFLILVKNFFLRIEQKYNEMFDVFGMGCHCFISECLD